MYFFLSSTDSIGLYPTNHAWDFTVEIGKYISLKGEWKCALIDINIPNSTDELYIFCDLCESNYVMDNFLPLLRTVRRSFTTPYYINISPDHASQIRVYIKTKRGTTPSFTRERLTCTLHVTRA